LVSGPKRIAEGVMDSDWRRGYKIPRGRCALIHQIAGLGDGGGRWLSLAILAVAAASGDRQWRVTLWAVRR
jgi:hypothetical protein